MTTASAFNAALHSSAFVVSKDNTTETVTLAKLAEERKHWEANAYRSSNQQLYALLAKCYAYYIDMRKDTDEAKQKRKALGDFIEHNGIAIRTSTHGITRILKCVFFDGASTADRRRISTYSIVLRTAMLEHIPAEAVAEFIESHGGVQEIRLAKAPNSKTAKQKAEIGKSELDAAPILTKLHADELSQKFDVADFDNVVALLGVVRASGDVEVRAVVRAQSALTAALAAHYTASNDTTIRKIA